MKEYFRQNPNTNKHRQHNKGSCKMHNSSAKFNPKTWAYFNKYWAIGKNIVANFLRQSENLGNKNKTQKKPSQLNTIENMEAVKAGITEKSLLITHIFHRQRESALNFAYDTLI